MICTVHTKSCYELNKHIRTLIINLSKVITLTKHHHDNLTIDFNTSTQNTHHRFSLTSAIVLNTLTYKAPSEIMTLSPRYKLNKLLDVDDSRPLVVPHEFLQPVEVPILEFIYNTRYNHKLYNLIQNTSYEQPPHTDERNIIKALELLWPLLQNKHIFRLLAELLNSSDIIHDVFPHGFFTDD